jgi:ligand-binding sensor domain-containing protein
MHVRRQLKLASALALLAAATRPGLALDPQSPASSYRRTTFTTEDGLEANVINDILQARDGSLWIATYAGLTRFDGQHFTFEFQMARNLFSKGRQEAIQTFDNAMSDAKKAIVEGRDAIHDLRREAPQSDLEHLLRTAGEEIASSQILNDNRPIFRVTVEGQQQALSAVLQDELYKIGRELLRNAFRHASASRIEAEIRYSDRLFRLRIRDDGKGMDRKVLQEGSLPNHWGLPGIRERAKGIGGRLTSGPKPARVRRWN